MIRQLIIKFRAADADPSQPDYLERLSRVAGVKLTYVRALFGSVHVFGLPEPMDTTRANEVVQQLNRHPDVQYAEPDWPVHHMR